MFIPLPSKSFTNIRKKKSSPAKIKVPELRREVNQKKAFAYEIFISLNDVMDTEVLQNLSE